MVPLSCDQTIWKQEQCLKDQMFGFQVQYKNDKFTGMHIFAL